MHDSRLGSQRLSRRSLLASLPAGAVAPYLAPVLARAEADTHGGRPMRFVFLVEGNGMPARHVMPEGFERAEVPCPRGGDGGHNTTNGADALIDLPLDAPQGGVALRLPETLAPLEPHRRRVTLLTGLSGRVAGGGHGCGYGALGAYPNVAGPKDITIDAALARTAPAIYQHVALGFVDNTAPDNRGMFDGLSAAGPNQKVPFFQDPVLAHTMLFGKILGADAEREIGSQSILLDVMANDIRRLRPRLPGEEGQKLERTADAFAAIRRRQARLREIDPKLVPPLRQEFHGAMVETTRMEAHVDIAATALITGLTNTVTLCSGGNSYPTWKGLGITADNHTLGHDGVEGAKAMRVKIRQFNAGLIAKLVAALEAVPEGDGTMMDNTLIVYLSDAAETHHARCMEWPMVLVGDLGSRLRAGGRFINLPTYGAKGHATVAQFYTALLHAAGGPVDHFGMPDRQLVEAGLDQKEPWLHLLA